MYTTRFIYLVSLRKYDFRERRQNSVNRSPKRASTGHSRLQINLDSHVPADDRRVGGKEQDNSTEGAREATGGA